MAHVSVPQWEMQMQNVPLARDDVNRLLMDFFVAEGFADAAESFAEESGILPECDLTDVRKRTDIRSAVHQGDIDSAVERTNALEPSILRDDISLMFRLKQQQMIEYIRQGKIEDALTLAREEMVPLAENEQSLLGPLEDAMCLLAFAPSNSRETEQTTVPPHSLGDLMDVSHRQQVATELNARALVATGQGTSDSCALTTLLRTERWAEWLKGYHPVMNRSTGELSMP